MIELDIIKDVNSYFSNNAFRPIERKSLVLKYPQHREKINFLSNNHIIKQARYGGNQYYPTFLSLIVADTAESQHILETIKIIYNFLYKEYSERDDISIAELIRTCKLDTNKLNLYLYFFADTRIVHYFYQEKFEDEALLPNKSIIEFTGDKVQIFEDIVEFPQFDDFLLFQKNKVHKTLTQLQKNNTQDRLFCRQQTRELLKVNPNHRIDRVVKHLKKEHNLDWKETTIRKWIKDLFKNSKAGRPPLSEKF